MDEYSEADKEAALTRAKELAEHVLSLTMMTPGGRHAKNLARKVLGLATIVEADGDRTVGVVTNGTFRLIPYTEPVFLLRAQDVVAPEVVRHWAKLAKKAGASTNIVDQAMYQADKMDNWPMKKVPDLYDLGELR